MQAVACSDCGDHHTGDPPERREDHREGAVRGQWSVQSVCRLRWLLVWRLSGAVGGRRIGHGVTGAATVETGGELFLHCEAPVCQLMSVPVLDGWVCTFLPGELAEVMYQFISMRCAEGLPCTVV